MVHKFLVCKLVYHWCFQLLVDQVNLGFTIVGGLDGGAAFYDRAYLEFHSGIIGCGFQCRVLVEFAINLIAVALCIAVEVCKEGRSLWDNQWLAIDGDGNLRYHRSIISRGRRK